MCENQKRRIKEELQNEEWLKDKDERINLSIIDK